MHPGVVAAEILPAFYYDVFWFILLFALVGERFLRPFLTSLPFPACCGAYIPFSTLARAGKQPVASIKRLLATKPDKTHATHSLTITS